MGTSGQGVRSLAADWCCRWLPAPRVLVLRGEREEPSEPHAGCDQTNPKIHNTGKYIPKDGQTQTARASGRGVRPKTPFVPPHESTAAPRQRHLHVRQLVQSLLVLQIFRFPKNLHANRIAERPGLEGTRQPSESNPRPSAGHPQNWPRRRKAERSPRCRSGRSRSRPAARRSGLCGRP